MLRRVAAPVAAGVAAGAAPYAPLQYLADRPGDTVTLTYTGLVDLSTIRAPTRVLACSRDFVAPLASVEPLAGYRHWLRGGNGAGQLGQAGLRGRVPLPLGLVAFPSLTVARGSLAEVDAPSTVVRGLQSSVAVRWMGW